MSYRLQGLLAAFLLSAACTSNYQPSQASVMLIERTCDIIETEKSPEGMPVKSRVYKGDCKSVDDWDEAAKKHDKTISGKAVVKVGYTAPQDGRYRTSELKFTSRDAEFYDLKAGDEIAILVRNDDPTRIITA